VQCGPHPLAIDDNDSGIRYWGYVVSKIPPDMTEPQSEADIY